jgi:hypothetical protein
MSGLEKDVCRTINLGSWAAAALMEVFRRWRQPHWIHAALTFVVIAWIIGRLFMIRLYFHEPTI